MENKALLLIPDPDTTAHVWIRVSTANNGLHCSASCPFRKLLSGNEYEGYTCTLFSIRLAHSFERPDKCKNIFMVSSAIGTGVSTDISAPTVGNDYFETAEWHQDDSMPDSYGLWETIRRNVRDDLLLQLRPRQPQPSLVAEPRELGFFQERESERNADDNQNSQDDEGESSPGRERTTT